MASLMRRARSPFWYIQHRNIVTGKWIRTATKYRIGIGEDTRKARELAAEYTVKENKMPKSNAAEFWVTWVDGWIGALNLSPLTVKRYQNAWENLAKFMKEREIPAPRYVTYALCMDYMEWRKKNSAGRKKRPASHNTAVVEIKLLGLVMGEAVRRGFADANPCRELRIGRVRPKEKAEITDDQIKIIREALKTEDEWMRDAFELAIHHGCRISECKVPMNDVDFEHGVIFFRKMKGNKPFTVPIHPGILPLLQRKKASGAQYIADVPQNDSKPFSMLFKKLGFQGISFHSTRVTVVSRLARCPEIKPEIAMRYVNHSSELVHRIYQRIRSDDLLGVSGALNIPEPGKNPSSGNSGAQPTTPEHGKE